MNRNTGKGVEALALAPHPPMPALLGPRARKPLADHVPVWLFWMEHALGLSRNTIVGYGFDARMFVAFCERIGCVYADQVTFQVVEAFGASLRVGLGQAETTISRRYSAMKRFFFFLKREGSGDDESRRVGDAHETSAPTPAELHDQGGTQPNPRDPCRTRGHPGRWPALRARLVPLLLRAAGG